MIHLKNVSFGYKRRRKLFDSLDMELESGGIYGLLGRNGAGKSSLLRIIHGLLYPWSGKVEVLGFTPKRRSAELFSDIYMIAEEQHIPNMKIRTFMQTYASFYPKFSEEQFWSLLDEFELDKTGHMRQLSWGQKKKVLLSFGLATNSRLLLMDEPTNGLDIPSKSQFRQLISGAITPDRTFIISSHQIRDLHSLLDTIVILENGKIIFHESLGSILDTLSFQVVHHPPKDDGTIYYERIPGGYMTVRPQDESEDSLEADIEILFNAIISNPGTFDHLFKKQPTHAD